MFCLDLDEDPRFDVVHKMNSELRMKIKCIVLGSILEESRPITLNKILLTDATLSDTDVLTLASFVTDVELVCRNYVLIGSERFDLIFAYKEGDRENGILYLGKWNSGYIEKEN